MDGSILSMTTLSALWFAQIGHQNLLHVICANGRLMDMYNFHTRPLLVRPVEIPSDSECRVLGKARFTNTDGINWKARREPIGNLKRALWVLGGLGTSESLCRKGSRGPTTGTSRKSFVVFKYRSEVTLYTKDISETPMQWIHDHDEHAIRWVPGLALLQRCTNN